MSSAFSVELPSGALCLGEREGSGEMGTCIVLHDVGQDLDRMRPMAQALRRVGFESLLVDLPGHGMSSGDVGRDGADVLPALLGNGELRAPVTAIGEGHAADLLLRGATEELSALALLAPRSDVSEQEYEQGAARRIPTLVVLDPHDEPAVAISDMIARHARAPWGRVFAHRGARSESGLPLWAVRTADAAAHFLAEKATFAQHPRGSHAAPLTENKRLS